MSPQGERDASIQEGEGAETVIERSDEAELIDQAVAVDEMPAQPEPEVVVVHLDEGDNEETSVEAVDVTDIAAEVEVEKTALELVEDLWTSEEVVSLRKLLAGGNVSVAMAARNRLKSLLAAHAPVRPVFEGQKLLTLLEWSTVNLLAGYNLNQGEVPRIPKFVELKLRLDYITNNTDFTQTFTSALKKLLTEDAKIDRIEGQPMPVIDTREPDIADSPEEEKSEPTITDRIEDTISKILRRTRTFATNEQKRVLAQHLSGETIEITNGYYIASRGLRVAIDKKLRQQREAAQRHNGKWPSGLTEDQAKVLLRIVGSEPGSTVKPMTLQQILKKRKDDQPGDRIEMEHLQAAVLRALHNVA